jgi:GTPase SAR1 family protein
VVSFLNENLGDVMSFLKKANRFLKGEKLVILGQRGTGKTTLLNFLIRQHNIHLLHKILEASSSPHNLKKIQDIYEQTTSKVKVKRGLGFFSIWSSKTYDVGGSEDHHAIWESEAKDADVLIYLFRVDLWKKDPDQLELSIEKDLLVFKKIFESRKEKKTFIIGTHIDKDADYKNNEGKPNGEAQYYETTYQEMLPIILRMKSYLGGKKCEHYFSVLTTDVGIKKTAKFIMDRMG